MRALLKVKDPLELLNFALGQMDLFKGAAASVAATMIGPGRAPEMCCLWSANTTCVFFASAQVCSGTIAEQLFCLPEYVLGVSRFFSLVCLSTF